MVSKYIQYFLNENNLELGEEFTIVYENGSKVYKDNEAFFFKNTPTYTNDILISKKDENFCPTILLGLLTGLYYVKKKPWQPKIGDVYFYVAVDEGKNKGVIHSETLFNKNDIKFLLLKKAGKYYQSYFEAEKHLKQDYEDLTGEKHEKYDVKLIETYVFDFEVTAKNRVEAEAKAKEYIDNCEDDIFANSYVQGVFKIIPKT